MIRYTILLKTIVFYFFLIKKNGVSAVVLHSIPLQVVTILFFLFTRTAYINNFCSCFLYAYQFIHENQYFITSVPAIHEKYIILFTCLTPSSIERSEKKKPIYWYRVLQPTMFMFALLELQISYENYHFLLYINYRIFFLEF